MVKRPLGITVIAILGILGGLGGVAVSLMSMLAGITVLNVSGLVLGALWLAANAWLLQMNKMGWNLVVFFGVLNIIVYGVALMLNPVLGAANDLGKGLAIALPEGGS